LKILETDLIIEMANIRKKLIGTPANLWLDSVGVDRNVEHNLPRLKVQGDKGERMNSTNLIPVSISTEPSILVENHNSELSGNEWKQVFKFIQTEYEMLMKHWNHEISDDEIILYFSNKYS